MALVDAAALYSMLSLPTSLLAARPLLRVANRAAAAALSSQQPQRFASSSGDAPPYLLYSGVFTSKLRFLRRFSLSSTLISMCIPFALAYQESQIPAIGQAAVIGTALLSSGGSTLCLQLLSSPYVCMLHEKPRDASTNVGEERLFVATRLNMLGNPTTSEFRLSQCARVTAAQHPFASFVANKNYYYIGRDVKDEKLKEFLQ